MMKRDLDAPLPEMTSRLEPGEKPTLKTLSRLSGLAVATVSRALSDAPDISETTKRKVRRIADEVGYVPNRAGVRLRTGKTNVIALILGSAGEMMNHTTQLISSISEELRTTPYHLIVMPRLADEDPMRAVRYVVETGSADGIIMNQTEAQDPRVAYLLERRFPFATHGRTEWTRDHAFFDYSNEDFARQTVHHLVARGRKRLFFVLPPSGQCYSQHLYNGAISGAQATGADLQFAEGVTSDNSIAQIKENLAAALTNDPQIDAIVCASPSAAMAAVGSAERLGHVIGEDIDIVGKEATGFLKEFRNEIIRAPENVSNAGRFLAIAVRQAIHEPEKPPLQQLDVPNNEFF